MTGQINQAQFKGVYYVDVIVQINYLILTHTIRSAHVDLMYRLLMKNIFKIMWVLKCNVKLLSLWKFLSSYTAAASAL